jgi:hypothetical protein
MHSSMTTPTLATPKKEAVGDVDALQLSEVWSIVGLFCAFGIIISHGNTLYDKAKTGSVQRTVAPKSDSQERERLVAKAKAKNCNSPEGVQRFILMTIKRVRILAILPHLD